MRLVRILVAAATALVVLVSGTALAQTADPEVEIVDVALQRYDRDGSVQLLVEFRSLPEELDPTQLVVTENGVPVSGLEVEPISAARVAVGVVLVIDTSGSMAGDAIEAAKTAAKSFVAQKRPEDFIALVTFSDEVTVLSNFTNSANTLIERIDALEAEGGTAMFDGIIRATELYASSSSDLRQNMIILTDGADENSENTLEDAIAAVEGQDIRTFGVALESGSFSPDDLNAIVDSQANGLFLSTPDPEELSSLYSQIQRELNNTLVVRFSGTVANPSEVSYGIRYGTLQASTEADVPGFVTTTTRGPTTTTTTTTTLALAVPSIVESPLPYDRETMRWGGAALIGLATAAFLFILLGGNRGADQGPTFSQRLAAYGRRGGPQQEKRSFFQRIPLLGRFTARAEEEVKRRGLLGAVNATLEQANIPLSAGEAIASAFGLSAVLGLLVALFSLNPIPGLVVFAVSILLVFAVINFIGGREKKKFENQLPDTLTLISTSLRAGYSLLQAVEAVAQEAPNPTAREFQRAIAEARLGVPVTTALEGITTRTQSSDFEWAVMAIEIQREVGGNLSEVLQTVADTMLARNRLKGEIRALTAEGRISAFVLGSLPFAMALFLWTTNRKYLQPLFENTFGLISVGVGLTLIAAGIYWLRKIITIEV